jgi:hypothetical protein
MEELDARWRKSSYSDNGGNCVEVANASSVVVVRDTKDRGMPALEFSAVSWQEFVSGLK